MFSTFFQEMYSNQVYDEPVYAFEIKSLEIFHWFVLREEEVFIGLHNLKYCIRPSPNAANIICKPVANIFTVLLCTDVIPPYGKEGI